MKKCIIATLGLLFSLFICVNQANAAGIFYTEATYPLTATGVKSTKPVTNLKKGTAQTTNILYLIELGDAGIKEAAQSAGIKQVHFIDVYEKSIFVFFKKTIVNVYGE